MKQPQPGFRNSDLLYGAANSGIALLSFMVNSWLLYFYLPPSGSPLVTAALFGVAVFVAKGGSALITPLVGHLSDNFHSRLGRRLPFMIAALIPVLAAFVFLWVPPSQHTSSLNFLYLIGILLIYRVGMVFFVIPYQALLPEIAATDAHRVRLSAWQAGFLILGMLIGGLAGWLIEAKGILYAGLVCAGFALVVLGLPIYFLRDRMPQTRNAPERIPFGEGIKITFRNRNFVIFALVWALYLMATQFVQSAAPFIVTEVCLLSEADTVYFYVPAVLASLAFYPVVTWLVSRRGKHSVYSGSLLASAILFPMTLVIGSWLPIPLLIQCSAWAIFQAVAISGVAVLSFAFVADISDQDERVTGLRREGVYFAVMKVLEEIFTGIAVALLPMVLLLGRSQSSPNGPLGVQITGAVGGAMMLIGYLFFTKMRKDKLFSMRKDPTDEIYTGC